MTHGKRTVLRGSICAVSGFSLALCLVVSGEALAQQRSTTITELSPDNAKAAWRLQAEVLSEELHLPDDVQTKLLAFYVAARESHQEAERKLAAAKSPRSEYRAASALLNRTEREKLETALKRVLTDEQASKAIESLGTFSSRWDRYVDTLTSYNLDDNTSRAALKLVSVYIVDHGKALREARSGGGRLSPSTSAQLKGTLDTGLAKLLSDDQISDWKKRSAFRGAAGTQPAQDPTNTKQPGNRKPANRNN